MSFFQRKRGGYRGGHRGNEREEGRSRDACCPSLLRKLANEKREEARMANEGEFDDIYEEMCAVEDKPMAKPMTREQCVAELCHVFGVLSMCKQWHFGPYFLEAKTKLGLLEEYCGPVDREGLLDGGEELERVTFGMIRAIAIVCRSDFVGVDAHKILLAIGELWVLWGDGEMVGHVFSALMMCGAVGSARILAADAREGDVEFLYNPWVLYDVFVPKYKKKILCNWCAGPDHRWGRRPVKDCERCATARAEVMEQRACEMRAFEIVFVRALALANTAYELYRTKEDDCAAEVDGVAEIRERAAAMCARTDVGVRSRFDGMEAIMEGGDALVELVEVA